MFASQKNTYLSPSNTEEPQTFPPISQPKIVGSFSVTDVGPNRCYLPDARHCKYVYKNYHTDRINYNLNDGIEQVIQKPDSANDEKLNHLLEFIVQNKQRLRKSPIDESHLDYQLFADFVCFRGLLRLLMCSPYERRDSWNILATKYKGTIYLCAKETEKQKEERNNRNDTMKRILSYGFKFEQFILSDDPTTKPSTNAPVNECEEFCCMFSTKLNGQRVLYGAEMDGIECDHLIDLNSVDLNQCQFVELKVKLRERHERQKQNFYRFKLRNWWCQCFLVNIKKIIVGTRTDDGIVNQLSTWHVSDIPKQCKKYWSASVCMEFCNQFLQLVAKQMQNINSPYDVFSFEFDPTKSDYVYMKTYTNRNEFSFLPEWFIQEMETSSQPQQ